MALLTVHPTSIDEGIAREVASHTDRRIEHGAEVLTWGADEHVLIALAAVGWLLTREGKERDRRLGNHFLACSLVTAVLPHVMKRFKTRPNVSKSQPQEAARLNSAGLIAPGSDGRRN
jgi:hypothetical protein